MDEDFPRQSCLARELTGANQVEAVAYGQPKPVIFQNYGISGGDLRAPASIEQAHRPDEFLRA